MSKKTKPFFSTTAEMVCLLRAKSFNEKREFYKSDDYVSVLISHSLNSFLSIMHKSFVLGFDGFNPMLPAGIYEYVVARTRYIDNLFSTLPAGTSHVFILGAGYDSRGFRFQETLKSCLVYECDHPDMQTHKRRLLENINIDYPANVKFVPIDFSNNSFDEWIKSLDLKPKNSCFFLLEGLTMYLSPQQMKSILHTVSQVAAGQCRLFFDYAYAEVIRGEYGGYNEAECIAEVRTVGEPWKFGIEKSALAEFLQPYRLAVVDEMTSRDIEHSQFTDQDGRCHGHVIDSVAWVLAQRINEAGL
ncbi:SAM-dependent methyltransferase [Sodalis sp. dw_96]|uniref:class I SAM-dependent methyltransferase n=1 Tax=Sodalis sp. dw_96 TaxID=2719794 RepID=UPI001BD6B4BF|nr:SAM-dependent methyltransferase [Sodalis sp. dw_96]